MNKIYRYGKLVLFLALVATLLCVCVGAMAENCADGEHQWYYDTHVIPTTGYACGSTFTIEDRCTVTGCTATWNRTVTLDPHKEGTPTKDAAASYAATCTTPGLDVFITKCTRCGTLMSTAQTVIPALGHLPKEVEVQKATCEGKGIVREVCSRPGCNIILSQSETAPLGHLWGGWMTTTEATCTEAAIQTHICSRDSNHKETQTAGAPLGHIWNPWKTSKPATCTTGEEQTRTCARNSAHVEKQTLDNATGHKWDAGTVTTPATCTAKGVKTFKCTNSGCTETRTEDIPALGHKWDAGTVTTPATCEGKGVKTFKCTNAGCTETKTEEIPALGHKWNEGTVTKPATCEAAGEKLLTCTTCGQTKTETIPALGHKWDAGVVIKPATTTETGTRLYTCQNDKSHTKTETIPVVTLANNTLCAIGPMLRDQRYYSAWYMFTPIDVSKDGRQTFDLIASKAHVVGTLTVEVRNGNMTVDYKVTGNTLKVTLEAFTVAGSMNEITRYEPEDLVYSGFRVRTPINLQETFGDDRNLILYFCSRCDYTVNQRWADFSEKSASYRSTVSQMLSLMDRDY